MKYNAKVIRVLLLSLLSILAWQTSLAGPLRERLQERRTERTTEQPAKVLHDIPYGDAELQRFDVYLPSAPKSAPIILMVHGGGWANGDKSMRSVVQNKAARWVPKGIIFISTNYRMLPDTNPIEQARDVARALAAVQDKAASWGGDPRKVILMGHSAGAHLVALLATDASLSAGTVTTPWLGTVALDSAAFDVALIMGDRHMRLYDDAFGQDPAFWKAASPYHALTAATHPILAVCSTRREAACFQAKRFADKAESLGVRAAVLEKDLSHREINQRLGEDPGYTSDVEAFLAGLDESVAGALKANP